IVEPVLEVPQVGQDQVDAGLVMGGEQHPAVHDEQTTEMLENGHVAADFVDSPERGHPQPAGGQRPRWSEFGIHCRSTPAARMSAASSSTCSSVAGICGNLGSPTSNPCSRRPAFDNVTPPSLAWAWDNGPSVTLILRA